MANYINDLFLQNPTFLIFFVTWGMIWKGLGLWTASRKNQKSWFIVMLIMNTLGILEILYVFFLKRIDIDQYFLKAKNLFTSRFKKGKISE